MPMAMWDSTGVGSKNSRVFNLKKKYQFEMWFGSDCSCMKLVLIFFSVKSNVEQFDSFEKIKAIGR